MLDFDVQRCTRRCSASGRDLRPGDTCYSVLVPRGAQVARLDFAADAWKGPPDDALGWWKGRVPEGGATRTACAPNDVMLDYFDHLAHFPDKSDVRYVLALLLVRRRVIRLENTVTDEHGQETLVVFCPRNEQDVHIPAILPDDERIAEIQTELSTLLFGDTSTLFPALEPPATEQDAATTEEPAVLPASEADNAASGASAPQEAIESTSVENNSLESDSIPGDATPEDAESSDTELSDGFPRLLSAPEGAATCSSD